MQFSSLLAIYITSKLRIDNQNTFKKLIDNLYNNKNCKILVKIINENIEKIIKFTKREDRIENFFSKFKGKFHMGLWEDNNIKISTDKKRRYQKVYFPIIKKFRILFPKYSNLTWYLSNQLIIHEIFNKEENLWYKIMRIWDGLMGQQDIKRFIRIFLKIALENPNSRLSQSMDWLDYDPIEINNELLFLLQKVWKKINYGKIIDETIHNLINNDENIILLNLWYDPSSSEYYGMNDNLVSHIWHLIRSYRLIWDELDLGNMPMFLIKNLIKITDRSKYQDNYYEYTTASYYLISEYYDEIEYLCDNVNIEYLGIYFAMVWQLLSSDKVATRVKESIISGIYRFLCNSKNKEEKKIALINFFKNYTEAKPFFNINAHDRNTHELDSKNKDIDEICR